MNQTKSYKLSFRFFILDGKIEQFQCWYQGFLPMTPLGPLNRSVEDYFENYFNNVDNEGLLEDFLDISVTPIDVTKNLQVLGWGELEFHQNEHFPLEEDYDVYIAEIDSKPMPQEFVDSLKFSRMFQEDEGITDE